MRAKNKIVLGFLREYRFVNKSGKLYLKCLEFEYEVNRKTVKSIQVIDFQEIPSLARVLIRGYILSKLFGLIGMIAGTTTAKKNRIVLVRITFFNDEVGLAEIDSDKYELLVNALFDI